MRTFFIIFLSICMFSVSNANTANKLHPYHVGSLELKYNATTKTFEITGKFFLDDLEHAINKEFGTALHFQNQNFKRKMNDAMKSYFLGNIQLKVNNEILKINYLGYEEDKEAVKIYMESSPVKSPKKVETAFTALYNLFDDQINIIHIIVHGKRQSHKLVYPERYLFKNF